MFTIVANSQSICNFICRQEYKFGSTVLSISNIVLFDIKGKNIWFPLQKKIEIYW